MFETPKEKLAAAAQAEMMNHLRLAAEIAEQNNLTEENFKDKIDPVSFSLGWVAARAYENKRTLGVYHHAREMAQTIGFLLPGGWQWGKRLAGVTDEWLKIYTDKVNEKAQAFLDSDRATDAKLNVNCPGCATEGQQDNPSAAAAA